MWEWGDIGFSYWKLLRLPEGPLYTTTNSTTWSTLATHLPSLCLGVLFTPSDPWHSSYSPSHRPSTFELCDLLMTLSRTWTASKLCRWLAGENQRIYSPLFYSVIFLQIITFTCILSLGLKGFYIFNLLTQQVHQVSSVGAGSFPLTRDSERVLRVDSASM